MSPAAARRLTVSALELPARWAQPERALADVDRALSRGAPPDLALLPEAALTGYVSPAGDFDLAPFAEPLDGPTARALAELASRHGCALAGPLVEREGDRLYTALVVFDARGERVAHYRKRHPWYPETWATAGEAAAPVFEVAGARVTVAICFDVHFLAAEPEPLRRAEVLLFPAAWVEEGDSRDVLLPEVARTYDVAVVHANWGHGAPRVPGQGGSRILRRDGSEAARASGPGRLDATIALGAAEP